MNTMLVILGWFLFVVGLIVMLMNIERDSRPETRTWKSHRRFIAGLLAYLIGLALTFPW